MSPRTLNDRRVLDLLLVGLSWLAEDRPDAMSGWTGNGILRTMVSAGALSREQQQLLAKNAPESLRKLLSANAYVYMPRQVRGGGSHGLKQGSKGKLFIIKQTSMLYVSQMVFEPRGYSLLSTSEGREHGRRVASSFEPQLTRESFNGHWNAHRRQTSGMWSVGVPSDDGTHRSSRRAS